MNRLRSSHAFILAAALVALAAAIGALTLWLRSALHDQALRREADNFHTVTIWHRALEQERLGTLGLPPADTEFALLALQTSRLPDVLAVEAFSPDGKPTTGSAPQPGLTAPTPADWLLLNSRQPLIRFSPRDATTLEITVPLHEPESTTVTGAVRYLLDSTALQAELTRLDRRLLSQAALIWVLSALTLTLALTLVFRRLRRTETALLGRTSDLLRANQELTFAAKTSALGALTAHLVHGLRNPVAGLSSLTEPGPDEAPHAQWRETTLAARRIRQMIDEVVTLLREEKSLVRYEVPPHEVLATVTRDSAESAAQRQLHLTATHDPTDPLDSRTASLCTAILRNLTRNACEATPPGGEVHLHLTANDHAFVFTVTDDGPGIPATLIPHLFRPTTSTKPDGAGIGLAICHQLALALGATLTHEPHTPTGTCFRLTLPRQAPPPA